MLTNLLTSNRCVARLTALLVALAATCMTGSECRAQGLPPGVRAVDYTAQGLNDGLSWQDAYVSLQSALSAPGIGTTITQLWVAEGTYVPTAEAVPGNPFTATFALPDLDEEGESLLILGGFPNGGGDGSIGASNPALFKTYLDGDRDDNDNESQFLAGNYASFADNVLHVCTANVGANVTLSGCTIRGGFARLLDPDVPNSELGGGVLILTGTPTLRNLVVEFCLSLGDQAPRIGCGGGLYSKGSSLDIRDCVFRHCRASIIGGGLCKTEGNLLAVRCRFESCRAIAPGGRGGGLRVNMVGGEAHMVNCVFRDCIAEYLGGGASIGSLEEPIGGEGCGGLLPDQGLATFSNCLFIRNRANAPPPPSCAVEHGSGGGGLRTAHPTEIRNCTFVKNSARFGAAISSWHLASLLITDSVIWDNTHIPSACSTSVLTELDRQVWVCIPASCPCLLTITSSCVQGWGTDGPCGSPCPWDDNIGSDPKFFDGDDATDDGSDYNLRLSGGSPCVDTSNNGLLPPDEADLDDNPLTTILPLDLDMTARIKESYLSATVDMGAFEKPCRSDLDGNCGVGGTDLALLLGQWSTDGIPYSPCPPFKTGDLNSDCVVNGFDLAILEGEWGACPGCETEGGGAGAAAGGGAGESASSSMPGGMSDEQVHLLLIIWLATEDWEAALAWAQTVSGGGEPTVE